MSVLVILEIKATPETIEEVKGTFAAILGDTRAYEGCQGVEVKENQDDPLNLVLFEKWESRAHYEKYLAWRTETGAIEAMGKMLAEPPSIRYFDALDI